MDFNNFLNWEAASKDTIDFKKAYVDMAGDLIAGLLLSQIVFWNLPGKDGKTKLRVNKKGYLWLVKKHTDWWNEIRLTNRQVPRALKILEERNLIITWRTNFDGAPTTHIRIDTKGFIERWHEITSEYTESVYSNIPKVSKRKDTKRINESTQSVPSITETTTKTTTGGMPPSIPAYKVFVKVTGSNSVHKTWIGKMHQAVGDQPKDIALWQEIVTAWIGLGWNQRNISGMLDYFGRREIPGQDKKGSHNGNGHKSSSLTPAEQAALEYRLSNPDA